MKRTASIAWALLLILVWLTPLKAEEISLSPESFVVKNFQFSSGKTLPEITVEYATFGKTRKDSQGRIINGVVLCHGFGGNYSQFKRMTAVIGPGKPFDTDRFFFICPTALGSPGSSSPSQSGLGAGFPKYTFSDIVKSQYLLVTDHFRIKHLLGVAGLSMGGLQTLQWITQYPDFMDWAIPIAASASFRGQGAGAYAVASHIIRSDPAYRDGRYRVQPIKAMESAFMGLHLWYFTQAYFKAEFADPEALSGGLKAAAGNAALVDANDTLWRSDAMALFDVSRALAGVKARTLVIGVNSDAFFPPAEDLVPLAKAIPGASLFAYDSRFGHMGCLLDIGKAGQAIAEFLK